MNKEKVVYKTNNSPTVFANITDVEDLTSYLDDSVSRLKNSLFLHHYTTVDNFVKMIKSNSLHLANAKNMNDNLEYKNGDEDRWKNIFFSSFMAEEKESIGMWSMYGQPWEKGVKVSIPSKVIREWIRVTKQLNVVENYINTNKLINLDTGSLKLSSIAYSNAESLNIKGEEKLQWSTVTNINVANHTKELTGYIKDMAWSYEKEVRIKAEISNVTNIERVSIPLTDNVINAMIITPSPLFKGDLIKEIKKEIEISFQSEPSLFKNRLNIKTICSDCKLKQYQNIV